MTLAGGRSGFFSVGVGGVGRTIRPVTFSCPTTTRPTGARVAFALTGGCNPSVFACKSGFELRVKMVSLGVLLEGGSENLPCAESLAPSELSCHSSR